ncbi:ras-related protein Rab-9A-like [Ylistrum balloti]|uniref:ras-related protein Rab-9A-like n=1 Tax=Ylistrum balloti TaxID=509963 RepID=UPI002905E780|nr:ras-related protein Rab-9A-like [Ylistrum balloti]
MAAKAKLLKVVLLGDGGVGKSSLMNRFVSNKFDAQSFHTIGVEFLNKDVEVDNELYKMQIWDTAGQERFKSLRTPFYRGADCCLLTFAVDDVQSYRNLSMWRKEFLYYADIQDGNSFPFVIIGNKVDVENRLVGSEEAREWCQANGRMPYFETSAKDSTNVNEAFRAAVKRLKDLEDVIENNTKPSHGPTVDLARKGKSNSSGGCC